MLSATALTDLAEGDRSALLSGKAYAEFDIADAAQVVKLPEALRGQSTCRSSRSAAR